MESSHVVSSVPVSKTSSTKVEGGAIPFLDRWGLRSWQKWSIAIILVIITIIIIILLWKLAIKGGKPETAEVFDVRAKVDELNKIYALT